MTTDNIETRSAASRLRDAANRARAAIAKRRGSEIVEIVKPVECPVSLKQIFMTTFTDKSFLGSDGIKYEYLYADIGDYVAEIVFRDENCRIAVSDEGNYCGWSFDISVRSKNSDVLPLT